MRPKSTNGAAAICLCEHVTGVHVGVEKTIDEDLAKKRLRCDGHNAVGALPIDRW